MAPVTVFVKVLESCSTCFFCVFDNCQYRCRRHAPVIKFNEVGYNTREYPSVDEDYWGSHPGCGDHKPQVVKGVGGGGSRGVGQGDRRRAEEG